MPNSRLLKWLQGPVAARTRLRMGSPMHKVKPVQYPMKWLHFIRKYLSPRRNPSTCSIGGESAPMLRNDAENGKRQYRSYPNASQWPGLDSRLRRKPSGGRKSKRLVKLNQGRKIESSLIQRVKIHECARGKEQKPGSKRMRRRTAQRTSNRRKRNAMSRTRKRGRARTYSRSVLTRQHRKRTRKYRRISRNRSRKKRHFQRRKRIYRRRRSSDASDRRRIDVKPGPRISKERMNMTAETRNPKEGHEDNDKVDNPLDVKNICRSLVKSLHGIPADCRDVKVSEKSELPESQRGEKRKESHKKKHKHKHIRDKAQRKQHGKRTSQKRRKDPLVPARKRAGQRTRAAVRRGRLGVQNGTRRGKHGYHSNAERRVQARHQSTSRRVHRTGIATAVRGGQLIHPFVERRNVTSVACQHRHYCRKNKHAVRASSRGRGKHHSCACQQDRCHHYHRHHSNSHRRTQRGGSRHHRSKIERNINNSGGDLGATVENDDDAHDMKDTEKNSNKGNTLRGAEKNSDDDNLRGAQKNSGGNNCNNNNRGHDAMALSREYRINVDNVGDQRRRRCPRRFVA